MEERLQLEGRNSVQEALNADRTIDKILIKKDVMGSAKVIIALAKEKGIIVQEVSKEKLDKISTTSNHQGIIALCPAHEYASLQDIFSFAKSKSESPFIIVLDNIQDPHNLGAIIRTAECAGAHGVIIPKRKAVGLSAIVARTSAGAIEHIPIVKVSNIAQTIEELKKRNIWVTAGDQSGVNLFKSDLTGAVALVIGGEGEGVSQLVKKKCDFLVKIPMRGKISSLNASVAAGLLMYEVVRRRNS